MRHFFYTIPLAVVLIAFASGCSSTPSVNQSAVSVKDAETWLAKYCSKFDVKKASNQELFGDLIMRSNTREFKGQYPASLHFDRSGNFTMEVTNILGGTMMQMKGSPKAVELSVPSKPRYNRKNVTSYMGLELPVLAQLLHGDLPCPDGKPKVQTEGSTIVMQTLNWKWIFERASDADGLIPVRVRLVPSITDAKMAADQTILLSIDDWDREQAFAKKVVVKTFDGELKWTWRSRELK
jgi:outer membrane biogenesis lipoprotein LolB